MKRNSTIALIFMFLMISAIETTAQSDLQVFGFFQGAFSKLDGSYSAIANLVTPFGTQQITLDKRSDNYSSFKVQQLNLFFRKELSSSFTGWVNFEVMNSYNSSNDWGSFSLQEAWVNYQSSNSFNVKAGLLIPRFAYFNEIKNRWPLLPYITRPLIYESTNGVIDGSIYVPEQANIQVYGYFPISDVTLDYAVFAGNSEKKYILGNSSPVSSPLGSATDTTNFKMFGGRVGLKYGELRFGVSMTSDKQNMQSSLNEDVSRTRLGFDAGYSIANFFMDAEYISVNLSANSTTRDMNKQFYYGTLGYNFSEDLFAYGSYSYLKDNDNNVLAAGMNAYIFGVGYKPLESVVLKASYANYSSDNSFSIVIDPRFAPANTNVKLDYKAYQIAVSLLF